ncbi:MAG: alanine--glyoxylate aminotransferase family protein [Candidatus Hodarchaeaceae archaeon]|nr:alanine--glyoxylate aminotransferase family protein [Candidatus Hodarchaeaceae archaeon]
MDASITIKKLEFRRRMGTKMTYKKQLIMLPGPTNVPERVMNAMTKPIINHRGPEFRELYDSLLKKLRYAFQTKNDVFTLTSSGTGGVECAISNILSPGDKVLVPVNGVFSQRLKEKIETFGGSPIEIPVKWGAAATPDQIADAAEGQDVKAIAVVYNETSTGVTARVLNEIGKIAEEHDALYIVDAISILGGDELPVDKWGIDICIAGSQKCLACPPGLALISISGHAWEVIRQTRSKAYYFNLLKIQEFHERKETPFTPALTLWYALDEALTMLEEEGLEKRIKRHEECARAFYDAVREFGLEPFADEHWLSNTVIAVKNPPGITDKEIRDLMREKHGVVIAGGMGQLKGTMFRIGSMGIITGREVAATVQALRSSLEELGYFK